MILCCGRTFQKEVLARLPSLEAFAQLPLEHGYKEFVKAVLGAGHRCFKFAGCSSSRRRRGFWSPACQAAQQHCDRLQRQLRAHPGSVSPDDVARAKQHLQDVIREGRTAKWRDFASNLSAHPSGQQLFSTIRSMSGQSRLHRQRPVRAPGGKLVYGGRARARVLARHFVATTSPTTTTRRQHARRHRAMLKTLRETTCDITSEHLFSMTQLRQTIREIKAGKACGIDHVSPDFIKMLPKEALSHLLLLMNAVLVSQRHPGAWKKILLVPTGQDLQGPVLAQQLSLHWSDFLYW